MSETSLTYELKVLYPPEEQRSILLDANGVLIGRGDETHLTFDDEWISRQHCRIWIEGNTIWLEDLQSTNGTFLDGQLIDRQNILPGSKVQLGKIVLTVEVNAPNPHTLPFPEVFSHSQEHSEIQEVYTEDAHSDFSIEDSADATDHSSFDADEENLAEVFENETEVQEAELSILEELAESLSLWANQLDSPQNAALFKIKVVNLSDFETQPGPAAIRFLHLEIEELLQSEKISDEWITEWGSGDFLFAVHSMSVEQANHFAEDLHQLIQKQIFSYQGEILQIQLFISAVLTPLAEIHWQGTLTQLDEDIELARQSEKSYVLKVN